MPPISVRTLSLILFVLFPLLRPTHSYVSLTDAAKKQTEAIRKQVDSYLSLSDAATKRGAEAIQAQLEWIKRESDLKFLQHDFNFTAFELPNMPIFTPEHKDYGGNHDLMRARAGKLQASIREKQLQLEQLEEQIICSEYGAQSLHETFLESPFLAIQWAVSRFVRSSNVLGRKLARVNKRIGHNARDYKGIPDFLAGQLKATVRMVGSFIEKPVRFNRLISDPFAPAMVPHAPSIFARSQILERHLDPTLERVMNNRRHMSCIEPYLDEVLERFDDIEPQLPWLLDNIDVLAPYTGLMMKHFDELLLYSHTDKDCLEMSNRMLPYVDKYLSNLDTLGPHLTLLRPHVKALLKGNRIDRISPYIDKLCQKGYVSLTTSANMDCLLFWVGWTLRIPLFSRIFFNSPGCIQVMNLLAKYLPHRFVRKFESRNLRVDTRVDYGKEWNHVTKEPID